MQDGLKQCQDVQRDLDAFLDRGLPPESSARLDAHLAACADCARELELRRALRARVQSAARSIEAPPFLETRIRASLRTNRRVGWWFSLAGATAAAALFVTGAAAYQLGHLRWTVRSQESYISSVSVRVASLMRVGLGDHIHCSVFRKYPKNAPTLDEFTARMGPKYSGLIPIVRGHVPSDFRMVLAHQCGYHGRRFVHLALKGDNGLLSVVVARKSEGESFAIEGLLPALTDSDTPIYKSGVQRFQIAAFESRDFLVYVISDQPQAPNMQLMRAMAPELKRFLATLES